MTVVLVLVVNKYRSTKQTTITLVIRASNCNSYLEIVRLVYDFNSNQPNQTSRTNMRTAPWYLFSRAATKRTTKINAT